MSEMNANTELSLLPSLSIWTVLSLDIETVVFCVYSQPDLLKTPQKQRDSEGGITLTQ